MTSYFQEPKFAHTDCTVSSLRQCKKNVSGVGMREKTASSNSEDAIIITHQNYTFM